MHSRSRSSCTLFALPLLLPCVGAFFIASASSLLAQDAPKPPSTGETLQGPKVPPAGLEGNRAFGKDGQMKDGQGKDGRGRQSGSRPMAMRAYMQAVQSLDLSEEQRASIETAMNGFRTSMQAFEMESAPRLKELQEARKNAPADQPVDPALKAKFQELEKARPNFEAVMKQVDGVLNDEQRGALKVKVDEFKAKAAAEMKTRNQGSKDGMQDGAKKPAVDAPATPPTKGDSASGSKDGTKDDSAKKDGKKKSDKKKGDKKKKDSGKDKDQPSSDEPMNP